MNEIMVAHDTYGKPYFIFSKRIKNQLLKNNIFDVFLSISDEYKYAFAYVFFVRE